MQSRRSPFVNHQELKKVRRSRASSDNLGGSESQGNSPLSGQVNGFFAPLLLATNWVFPPVKRGPFYWLGGVVPAFRERWKVHGLYGCLGFEVQLADVVGLNYLNELQTGGCLALEATQIVKREFGNLREAVHWYRGGESEPRGASLGSDGAPLASRTEGLGQPWTGAEVDPIERLEIAARRGVELENEMGAQKGEQTGGAETEAAVDTRLFGSQLSESQPAAQPLSSELSLGPGGFLEETCVETAEIRAEREDCNLPGSSSRTGGSIRVHECTVTSPAYHSATASPSYAGTSFEALSASCRASRRLEFGSYSFEKSPNPDEAEMVNAGLAEKVLAVKHLEVETVTSAEVSLAASNKNASQSPPSISSSAALTVSVSREKVTKCPSPSVSETRLADCHRPAKAPGSSWHLSNGDTRGRAFLSSLQPSHSKLRFRRQRSRSLDDPVVKAVLERVAEQAARVATSPKHSDARRRSSHSALVSDVRRHSSPSLVTAGLSGARQWQSGEGSTPALPRLPVTARSRQNDLPSEPASPTETSPKPAPVAEVYTDRLVVFRFRDPLLPDALREAITTDQRLLKMLESGLPTWAVLVQSYPALCHVYRPWMRRVAGYLYFIVSAVTVLIGFYDLYKVRVLESDLTREVSEDEELHWGLNVQGGLKVWMRRMV